jgi:RHS repeat-associated protein
MKWRACLILTVAAATPAFAQMAPTGAHYAGRPTDTGHGGLAANAVGGYVAAVPLDLPPARLDLPIPLRIVHGGRKVGAAGLGWDVPLSHLQQQRTFARRRPVFGQYVLPEPRGRTTLSLLGREVELIPSGTVWVARTGTLELTARQDGDRWRVHDGEGRMYTFVRPAQLPHTGLWLLKSIEVAGAGLELFYQLDSRPIPGGSGIEISLIRVAYNTHPATGCAKHEITLAYEQPSTSPLALTMLGETALVRFRTLQHVDVTSRETCAAAPQLLRRYALDYEPDPDTFLPRLRHVRMSGRQGTPEETQTLPIATYEYGAATREGKLRYAVTQTILLPPEDDGTRIAGTELDGSADAPGSERYAAWQALTDVTGDGRPDLVLRKAGTLSVALNGPAAGGRTLLGPVMPLHDTVLTSGAFSTHALRRKRFMYPGHANDVLSVLSQPGGPAVAANHNVLDVWREAIDVNGDGRLDIVDAAEEPMRWTIYLNTPGGPTGVRWKRTSFDVTLLAAELSSRGHELAGNRVPLARRATSGSITLSICWRWLEDEEDWVWFDDGWGEVCFSPAPNLVLDRGPERTIVEWQLSDLNGDGYPDVVFNSTPVRFQLLKPPPWRPGEPRFRYGDVIVPFAPAAGNQIRAAYNVVGVRFDVGDRYAFARSVSLAAPGAEHGVAVWQDEPSWPEQSQRQIVGLADVNGDGLVDRVAATRAFLGVYIGTARAFSPIHLTLPGPLSVQASRRDEQCAAGPRFTSRLTNGLRDLTGDGIPDYYGGGRVSIGTGTGFTTPVGIESTHSFVLSHQTETCDGEVSNTDGGLYDIDGDGLPEIIGLVDTSGGRAYAVSQLAGSASPRAHDAGRLVRIDNGHGASTRITYQSAKDDRYSSHPVPFPEIVVGGVEVDGTRGLGGSLAGVRYAYGQPERFFDGALDAFTFAGYRRVVETYPYGGAREESFATVTDTWPLTPWTSATTAQERWLRVLRAGRVRDVHTLRGSAIADPWALVGLTASDTRVIGVTHQEWDARVFETAEPAEWNLRDCVEIVDPFDFVTSAFASQFDTCRTHGFAYPVTVESWYGGSPPPSTTNLRTRTIVQEVDDFGRPLFVQSDGDLARSDDDACVEITWAAPAAEAPRVLTAVASRRVTDCGRRITYAVESWTYDGLAVGAVSDGRLTAQTIERRATDNGALLRRVRAFDATYDAAGSLTSVTTARDGAERRLAFEYDPFGLAAVRTTLSATGVPSMETSLRVNPVSLEPLEVTNANGSRRGAGFDGFGRLVRVTVAPPGGQSGVVSATAYYGFNGNDPSGRRVAVTEYRDHRPAGEAASVPSRTVTVHLDELGRERRTELALGADYGGERLVIDERTYDEMGRLAFEAEPYPASADPATVYGTSYHYKRDGELACLVRGPGRQPLTNVTNPALELFPTCFRHAIVNGASVVEVQDAASLLPGSPQAGVVHRTVSSALGRTLERSTLQGTTWLDRAAFTYDRLGQPVSMTRFHDPAASGGPVRWAWRMDSIGQTIALEEPEASTRHFTYSDWGELVETRWSDGASERRLVQAFDALARLTAAHESTDGAVDSETVREFAYDSGSGGSPHVIPAFVLGRLAQAATPEGAVSFSYDHLGRTTARVFADADGETLVEETLYHGDGTVAALQFRLPDANFSQETVKYLYDSAGRLRAITYGDASSGVDLYRADDIDPLGRIRKAVHGGATTYATDYAETGRGLLREVIVETPHGHRQREILAYDPAGRELARRERTAGAAAGVTTATTYEALGRVRQVVRTEGGAVVGHRLFQYDALGNLVALEDLAGGAGASLAYHPVDRDRLCRVAYGGGSAAGSCDVQHDRLGNIVSQATRTGSRQIGYFLSGDVQRVAEAGVEARFGYDAFGQVREVGVQAGGADVRRDRRYGDVFERREVIEGGAVASWLVRRVPGPGGVVASRRGAGGPWVFEFGERRGRRVFTDAQGAFLQDVSYEPFGEAASAGVAPGTPAYSASQWNDGNALGEFGLSHLGARLYDPVIGRFLSRDPLVAPRGGATTNPYAFAMNDPVNLTDPTGLDPWGEVEPLNPLAPFDFGGGSDSSGCGMLCDTPAAPAEAAPAVHGAAPAAGPVPATGPMPAIGAGVAAYTLWLKAQVRIGDLTPKQASRRFEDFIRRQVYSNQHSRMQFGSWCAAATRQMVLKFAGIIQPGLSYDAIKFGLRHERSPLATTEGAWERKNFNWTDDGKFITRLGPEAIARVARNPAVGTGDPGQFHWTSSTCSAT